jgi:hypothetical protein
MIFYEEATPDRASPHSSAHVAREHILMQHELAMTAIWGASYEMMRFDGGSSLASDIDLMMSSHFFVVVCVIETRMSSLYVFFTYVSNDTPKKTAQPTKSNTTT